MSRNITHLFIHVTECMSDINVGIRLDGSFRRKLIMHSHEILFFFFSEILHTSHKINFQFLFAKNLVGSLSVTSIDQLTCFSMSISDLKYNS